MMITDLLLNMGINFRIVDDEAVAKCPYHNDSHPSWSININSGVHYCFSCGARGNLATLIRDRAGFSYAEAVIVANETVGHARMDQWREHYDQVSYSEPAIKITETDMALFVSPPKEALDSKHINDESARYYGIKWNPVRNTWIFPYRDPYTNDIWGWQEKNARIFRNYPPGTKRSRTLFGYNQLQDDGAPAFLLESPVDCAVLYSSNFKSGAVASFGVPNLYQLSLIQLKCETLYFCLDNDGPGQTATWNLLPAALQMFDTVKVFNYKSNTAKDVGEMTFEDTFIGLQEAIPALEWIRTHNDLYGPAIPVPETRSRTDFRTGLPVVSVRTWNW